MKKLMLALAFVSIGLFATAGSGEVVKVTTNSIVKKDIKPLFPVTIVTSCGTWTGNATCTGSAQDCAAFLNAVGDFLESLCP